MYLREAFQVGENKGERILAKSSEGTIMTLTRARKYHLSHGII